MEKINKTNFDFIDLFKIIMAFMIVALHTTVYVEFLNPIYRFAVPFFFIVSAFLFFKKINDTTDYKTQKSLLKKYVVRNLLLFSFWFIINSPIIIYMKISLFKENFFIGILKFIQQMLFASIYQGSWFMIALIIAVPIIFYSSKRLKNHILLIITSVIYILITLWNSYSFIFNDNKTILNILNLYSILFLKPFTSFPVALIYIVIGKIIAEKTLNVKKIHLLILFVIFTIILYLEWFAIKTVSGLHNSSHFLTMPFAVTALCLLIKQIDVKIKKANVLRKISTIIYCSHGSAIVVVRIALNILKLQSSLLNFICVIGSTIILALIIIAFQKKIKILKYAT